MDIPERNPNGYQNSSGFKIFFKKIIVVLVLNYAHKFPETENRLLIVHGLKDENGNYYYYLFKYSYFFVSTFYSHSKIN